MTIRPDPHPPPLVGVGLTTDSPPIPLAPAETGTLPSGALAVALSWDTGGRCQEARLDGSAVGPGGRPESVLLGDGWLDLLHSADRDAAAAAVRSVLTAEARTAPHEQAVRLAEADRWAVLLVWAVEGAEGVVGAAGVLVDATRSLGTTVRMARLVEELNRVRHPDEVVRAILGNGVALLGGRTAVVYVLSDDDELVVAGASGVPQEMLTARFGRIARSSPLPAAEVLRTGRPITVGTTAERRRRYPQLDAPQLVYQDAFAVVPLTNAAGAPFGVLGVGFDDRHRLHEAEPHQLLQDVATHCGLALDRARLAVAAERDQERLQFLDRLSGTLSSTLQLDATLTQLAGMAVPNIADWCVVRLAESTTNPRPVVGAAHVDAAQVAALRHLAEHIPRDLARAGQLGAALEAGRPLIRGSRAAQMLRPLFGDDDSRQAMDAVGVEGLAIFPLQARGRLLGAIGFGNRPGRAFTDGELDLAQSVAARAAVIVDNARLFDEQSVVARALQDSLLPGSLPEIPGVELGARYRAAGRGLDVGGDFYDAFQADANWWIFAVGDVCGHGVEAAATTGLVRHTIRSSAMAGVMPSAILARLNQMLLRHTAEWADIDDDHVPMSPRFCTVLVGAAQPTSRAGDARGVDLILCSGGHPLPLVGRNVGRVEPVGVHGTLLGVTDDVSLTDTVVHLDPGEALVCYTDGLIDRRSGRRAFGEEGVVKALYQGKGLPAPELASMIESEAVAFIDSEPTDDMAVLTLRAAPA
jgi:serine phosphatase RsbU (regulator of sigma subunit)